MNSIKIFTTDILYCFIRVFVRLFVCLFVCLQHLLKMVLSEAQVVGHVVLLSVGGSDLPHKCLGSFNSPDRMSRD